MAEITQLPQRDDDPYLAARQEYSDRYANLAAGKRNWQFAALGFFLVAVMSLAVSIIQVRQVKRIPYVVEADARTGYIITMPQPLAPSSTTVSINTIEQATIAEFIQDARSAIADFAGEDTLAAVRQKSRSRAGTRVSPVVLRRRRAQPAQARAAALSERHYRIAGSHRTPQLPGAVHRILPRQERAQHRQRAG